MGVVTSIIAAICEKADEIGACEVKTVVLSVGEARDIHESLLQRYFDYFSRGTKAEGVEVTVRRIPIKYRCVTCGSIYDYQLDQETEPECKDHPDGSVKIISGTELFIEEIGVV